MSLLEAIWHNVHISTCDKSASRVQNYRFPEEAKQIVRKPSLPKEILISHPVRIIESVSNVCWCVFHSFILRDKTPGIIPVGVCESLSFSGNISHYFITLLLFIYLRHRNEKNLLSFLGCCLGWDSPSLVKMSPHGGLKLAYHKFIFM